MKPDKSLVDLLKAFEKKHFRYLLIGGHAVIQYGSQILTKDSDFWVDPEMNEEILEYLIREEGLEGPPEADWKKPINSVFSDWQKIDLFSARKMTNSEGEVLDFDKCYKRSVVFQDPKNHFSVRVPSVRDLIALKKMKKPAGKDLEDLRFLESLAKNDPKGIRSR